jgi:hypothetical protein
MELIVFSTDPDIGLGLASEVDGEYQVSARPLVRPFFDSAIM